MINKFISRISLEFQKIGMMIDCAPQFPGVQALLYTWSPERIGLGVVKVEHHFLFVDWDNPDVGRLDQLKGIYQALSVRANQGFKVPHGWRFQIPSLAIVALSQAEFSKETVSFAHHSSLEPWYGGEVGQLILVELNKQNVISRDLRSTGRFPKPGAIPLGYAADQIRQACNRAFLQS
jgi:hypothetical protein